MTFQVSVSSFRLRQGHIPHERSVGEVAVSSLDLRDAYISYISCYQGRIQEGGLGGQDAPPPPFGGPQNFKKRKKRRACEHECGPF